MENNLTVNPQIPNLKPYDNRGQTTVYLSPASNTNYAVGSDRFKAEVDEY
jgi:hypothetical protein